MTQFTLPFVIPVTIKTPATLPVTPPRDVSGGQGKVGTLTITWTVSIINYITLKFISIPFITNPLYTNVHIL